MACEFPSRSGEASRELLHSVYFTFTYFYTHTHTHAHAHAHTHTQTDTIETLHRCLMYIIKSTLMLCKVNITCEPHTARRAVPRRRGRLSTYAVPGRPAALYRSSNERAA